MELIYLALITLFSSVFSTVSGFGIGTILTPILILFIPFTQALLFIGVLHWFNSVSRTLYFKKNINWKLAFYFGIPAIITSGLGAYLVFDAPNKILNITFGLFFILYSIFIFSFTKFKLKPSKSIILTGGILTGFSAGFFGKQGMIRSAFLTSFDLPSKVFVGTSGIISLFADTSRIITYLYRDITILKSLYFSLLICIPITFFSVWIGGYIINYIPQKYFRIFIISFLFIFGIFFIFKGIQ